MVDTAVSPERAALPVDLYSWRRLMADLVLVVAEWSALLAWLLLASDGAGNVYGAWTLVGVVLVTIAASAKPDRLHVPPPVWLRFVLHLSKAGQLFVLVWFAYWWLALALGWIMMGGAVWRDKVNRLLAAQEAAHV